MRGTAFLLLTGILLTPGAESLAQLSRGTRSFKDILKQAEKVSDKIEQGGIYTIHNKYGNAYLSAAGDKAVFNKGMSPASCLWFFERINDKTFVIHPVKDGSVSKLALTFPTTKYGSPLTLTEAKGAKNQLFTVQSANPELRYLVETQTNRRIGVHKGRVSQGTPVQMSSSTSKSQWTIKRFQGSGKVTFGPATYRKASSSESRKLLAKVMTANSKNRPTPVTTSFQVGSDGSIRFTDRVTKKVRTCYPSGKLKEESKFNLDPKTIDGPRSLSGAKVLRSR